MRVNAVGVFWSAVSLVGQRVWGGESVCRYVMRGWKTLRALFQEDVELPVNHADRRVWIRPAHLNTSLTPGALK